MEKLIEELTDSTKAAEVLDTEVAEAIREKRIVDKDCFQSMDNTNVLLYRHQIEEEGGHGTDNKQEVEKKVTPRKARMMVMTRPRDRLSLVSDAFQGAQEKKPWTRKVDVKNKESLRRGLENWLSWLMEQVGEVGAGE